MEAHNLGAAILVSLCIAAALAQPEKTVAERYKKIVDDCLNEQKVDPEKVKAVMKEGKMLENDELKCYFGCITTKLDFYKDGKVDWARIKEENKSQFEKPEDVPKANTVVDICQEKVEVVKDVCELAGNIMKCFFTEGAKLELEPPRFMSDRT